MKPLTFNPGPSKLSPETEKDMQDALVRGIPELSHRSAAYREFGSATVEGLRAFFGIPDSYSVLFTSSATDAMELIVRNVVQKSSAHFTCGRFSELFAETSKAHGHTVVRIDAPWGEKPVFVGKNVPKDADLVGITYCETSTGVMCSDDDIASVRRSCPTPLLAIDITSIAGMKEFRIADADIWFFSVQKGFGLPAGLGVIIVSPRTIERSIALRKDMNDHAGLFTFEAMAGIAAKGGQTLATPNVLGIYLLGKQLERWNRSGGAKNKEQETREKAERIYSVVEKHPSLRSYIRNSVDRSISVACIEGDPTMIASLHQRAAQENIILGKGYGKLKETTLRLALFPAITEADIDRVLHILE